MADENSIKDVVTLFNNDLRTEEQLKAKLLASEKEALVSYIIEDIKEVEDLVEEDDDGTDTDTDSELDYS